VIAGYEGESLWKTELAAMLQEDRVGVIEDSTGDRTVGRLVDSSLGMLKDAQASLVFMALGVAPEDVLIELAVAQLICGADTDVVAAGKLSAMSIRRMIKTLLDRNLLQGSIASGVQMHDIVRDLVRSRLGGDDGICAKQRAVVAAVVSASPADGWAPESAVGQYATLALDWHMAEVLAFGNALNDTEAQTWLLHSSDLIVASAATAFGSTALEALSAAKESASDFVGAARVAWAGRSVKGRPAAVAADLAFRAADLLEEADDASCVEFEMGILAKMVVVEVGSKRHGKATARHTALVGIGGASGAAVTFASKVQDCFTEWLPLFGVWVSTLWAEHPFGAEHWPCLVADDYRTATSQMRQAMITHMIEASSLSDIPIECHSAVLMNAMNVFVTSATNDMDDWDPSQCGGEAALVDTVEYFARSNRQTRLLELKNSAVPANLYLYGHAASILALYFGHIPALIQWSECAAAEYRELGLPRTQDYVASAHETMNSRWAAAVLVRIRRPAEALALLEAMGFTWTDDGFTRYGVWFAAMLAAMPSWTKDADAVWYRLLLYLASPHSATLDAEVCAWIPTPAAIAEHERAHLWSMHWGRMGLLCLAASVFLRLGRAEDAAEAARILVSPQHHCVNWSDITQGHSVLGQVAAARGDLDAASGHFGRALEAAAASRYPLLEVLAARDWQAAAPAHARSGAADAVIEVACAKMGKTREQLALASGPSA
jgi:hypothetical protein